MSKLYSGTSGWKYRPHVPLPVLQGDIRLVQGFERPPNCLAFGAEGVQVCAEQLQYDVLGAGGLSGTHAQSQVLRIPVSRVRRGIWYPLRPWPPSVRPLRPEAEDHGEVLLLHGLQVIVLEPGGAAAPSGDHHARLRVSALRQEFPYREVPTPSS